MLRVCVDRHPGPVPEECPICAAFVPRSHRGHSTAQAARRPKKTSRLDDPCPYLGQPTGEERACKTCAGSVSLKVLACSLHTRCTVAKPVDGVACCEKCDDHPAAAFPLTPIRDVLLDGADLIPDRNQMNCSILPYKGRMLLAYRTGWSGSRVHVCEVNDYYKPSPSVTLDLRHPLSVGGREDSRLFVHDGKLHLAYVGVRVVSHKPRHIVARQLFARLSDDLEIEHEWEPAYAGSEPMTWEKNWQPFSFDGRLYAVYSMRPWTVLELTDGKATEVGEPHKGIPWVHGVPRGGAPPVRRGDEFYCFFHGTDKGVRPSYYTMGVCTFEATPPFRPLRITRAPILRPDLERGKLIKREQSFAVTVFPCGAFRDGNRWVVSMGDCDHYCRVAEFDAAEIESRLRAV